MTTRGAASTRDPTGGGTEASSIPEKNAARSLRAALMPTTQDAMMPAMTDERQARFAEFEVPDPGRIRKVHAWLRDHKFLDTTKGPLAVMEIGYAKGACSTTWPTAATTRRSRSTFTSTRSARA